MPTNYFYDTHFPEKLEEFDANDKLIYRAHGKLGAIETDRQWLIEKYLYDGNDITIDLINYSVMDLIRWEDRLVSPTPLLSKRPNLKKVVNIEEQATTTFEISNYVVDTTYEVSANIGTISNITTKYFDYTIK